MRDSGPGRGGERRTDGPRVDRGARCDRCGLPFFEGYQWPGLGIPVVLCKDCADDLEESVSSYGEEGRAARRRLLDRLRRIGL